MATLEDPTRPALGDLRRRWAEGDAVRRPVRAVLVALLGWLVLLVAVSVGLGLLLTRTDVVAPLRTVDDAVARWMADHRAPWATPASYVATAFDPPIFVGVVVAIAVVLVRTRRLAALLVLAGALVLESTTFIITATAVGRDRPPGDPLRAVPPTGSFPSGHVAAAVCLFGWLAYLVGRRHPGAVRALVAALAAVGVLAVGWARAQAGLHHLTDLVAGALLGAVCLAFGVVLTDRLVRDLVRPEQGAAPRARRSAG